MPLSTRCFGIFSGPEGGRVARFRPERGGGKVAKSRKEKVYRLPGPNLTSLPLCPFQVVVRAGHRQNFRCDELNCFSELKNAKLPTSLWISVFPAPLATNLLLF